MRYTKYVNECVKNPFSNLVQFLARDNIHVYLF